MPMIVTLVTKVVIEKNNTTHKQSNFCYHGSMIYNLVVHMFLDWV